MVKKIFTGKFRWSQMDADENLVMMLIIGLVPLFLMFFPVPGTGMKVKDFADLWATDSSILIEGFALLATSVLLFIAMRKSKKMLERAELRARSQGESHAVRPAGRKRFNPIDAICVGLAQCVAAVYFRAFPARVPLFRLGSCGILTGRRLWIILLFWAFRLFWRRLLFPLRML